MQTNIQIDDINNQINSSKSIMYGKKINHSTAHTNRSNSRNSKSIIDSVIALDKEVQDNLSD